MRRKKKRKKKSRKRGRKKKESNAAETQILTDSLANLPTMLLSSQACGPLDARERSTRTFAFVLTGALVDWWVGGRHGCACVQKASQEKRGKESEGAVGRC